MLANGKITRPPKVFSSPKEAEQKKWPKVLIILIIFIFVIIGLVYFVYYSPFFKVKNIIFEGEKIENLNYIIGENIIFLDTETIKSDIKNKYFNVDSVQIIRGIPNTLKIKISYYQPKIVWQTNKTMYLVNNAGRIYNELQGATDMPVVKDNKDLPVQNSDQVVSTNFIDFIYDLTNKFSQSLGFKIVYFEVEETTFQVNAQTDRGWFVKLDTTKSLDGQITALKELLKEHSDEIKEYADVRVEGKVFYK